MNNNQTLEKLRQMHLPAMASLHRQHREDNRIESMGTDEYLALLVDHQWEDRLNRKIARLINQACFKQRGSLVEDRKSTRLKVSHVCSWDGGLCLKREEVE